MIAFVTLQLPYRYCDGWVCGFSMAIAIVVLYCAFASLLYRDRDSKLLYSDYYIAISRTVSRALYSDRNCSLAIIIIIIAYLSPHRHRDSCITTVLSRLRSLKRDNELLLASPQ